MKLTGKGNAPLFIKEKDIGVYYKNMDPTASGTTVVQKRDGSILVVKESVEAIKELIDIESSGEHFES
jgi:hypothetical protein